MYNNRCIFNPSFVCPMMRESYSNMNRNMGLNHNHDYNLNSTYENSFNPVEDDTFNIKFKKVSLNELVD